MKKIKLICISAAIFILGFGCAIFNDSNLANPLFNENSPLSDSLEYSSKEPGEAEVLDRSFENAPPLIPHSVEDLLPITAENNMCITCHSPEFAEDSGATVVPKTHLVNYRPTTIIKDGKLQKDGKDYINTAEVKTLAHAREGISADRYNCSQCHVPQTNNPIPIRNLFKGEFRGRDTEKKSDLYEILNEGVEY